MTPCNALTRALRLRLYGEAPGGATRLLEKPKEYSVTFRFPSSGDDRATIAVLDAGYTVPGWSKPIYENLRFSVHSKSRVALVGPNGCGKSTLLGLLTGGVQGFFFGFFFGLGFRVGNMKAWFWDGGGMLVRVESTCTSIDHLAFYVAAAVIKSSHFSCLSPSFAAYATK